MWWCSVWPEPSSRSAPYYLYQGSGSSTEELKGRMREIIPLWLFENEVARLVWWWLVSSWYTNAKSISTIRSEEGRRGNMALLGMWAQPITLGSWEPNVSRRQAPLAGEEGKFWVITKISDTRIWQRGIESNTLRDAFIAACSSVLPDLKFVYYFRW